MWMNVVETPRQEETVRLLIVDDQQDMTKRLRGASQFLGSHVVTASTAEQVLDLLDHEVFDVALVNAALLKGSRLTLFDLIHRIQPLLRVIILTDEQTVFQATSALRLGAFDIVYQSDSPDSIAAKILNAHKVRELHVRGLGSRI